jgi:hypothetical protein
VNFDRRNQDDVAKLSHDILPSALRQNQRGARTLRSILNADIADPLKASSRTFYCGPRI